MYYPDPTSAGGGVAAPSPSGHPDVDAVDHDSDSTCRGSLVCSPLDSEVEEPNPWLFSSSNDSSRSSTAAEKTGSQRSNWTPDQIRSNIRVGHRDAADALTPPPLHSSSVEPHNLSNPQLQQHQQHEERHPAPPPPQPPQPTAASPSPANRSSAAPTAVGLVNEGCTCYLNSLLQLLFHISYFRTAVYRIPCEADDDGPSVGKALQELFFQMQERTTPARTTNLTAAFGWGKREIYIQHDIQEMSTLLRDHLENRMKGTVTEGAINQLFEGRGNQFVETLDKSYVSRRDDVYFDIHVPLSEHTSLHSCLKSLTARDQLVGDNKYRVEREGLPAVYMDAEKGYSFSRFPTVAWFHLKRFAMDLTSPTLEMRKVNSRLEFPVVLDLRDLEQSAEEGGPSIPQDTSVTPSMVRGSAVVPFSTGSPALYDLQGVIVHRGTVRCGHYYCYIHEWDPEEKRFTRWLEYDDDNVREVAEDVAVRANYGGSDGAVDSFRHDTSIVGGGNAYILSYVRRADAPTVLAPSPTDIISERLKEAMWHAIKEEERQLRQEEEVRRTVTICCLTNATLAAYCDAVCSTELFARDPHLWRRHTECVIHVPKSTLLTDVYEAVATVPELAKRGIVATNCRLWRCSETFAFRPTTALPTSAESREEDYRISDFLLNDEVSSSATICVYVEQSQSPIPGLSQFTQRLGLIKEYWVHDGSQSRHNFELQQPTELSGFYITVEPTDHHVTVRYTVTTDTGVQPEFVVHGVVNDHRIFVQLDEHQRTAAVSFYCYILSKRELVVRDVHVALAHRRSAALSTALLSSNGSAGVPAILAKVGWDRALIFFKYYDCSTSTVQYVGAWLLDRTVKLQWCSAVYYQYLGFPGSPDVSAAASPSLFRFFLEKGDHNLHEMEEQHDLGELGSGSVIVAQMRAIPPVYRYLSAMNYYSDSRDSLDASVMEVRSHSKENDEAYRQAVMEQQQHAVAIAAAVAAAATATTSSSPSLHPSTAEGHRARSDNGSHAGEATIMEGSATSCNTPSQTDLSHVTTASTNPYEVVQLPILHETVVDVISPISYCKLAFSWNYEAVCSAIGRVVGSDSSQMQLYQNSGTSEPEPNASPVVFDDETTVVDLMSLEGYSPTSVLYYERLTVPRDVQQGVVPIIATLRDLHGYALHRESYVIHTASITGQGIVHLLKGSLPSWQREKCPWGTVEETLAATHFILCFVDPAQHTIAEIKEVDMSKGGSEALHIDAKWLRQFEMVLQPAAPLQSNEQRIACCHLNYSTTDRNQHDKAFGQPFPITIRADTTVNAALKIVLQVTHIPLETLNSAQGFALMMWAGQLFHFDSWDECLSLFWAHTRNTSIYIPSLILNHARPREKPGSRYVAQHNPQLKISSK